MKQYDQGQSPRLTATFRNPAGSVYDPDVVTFTIRHESTGESEQFIWDADDSESVDGDIHHTGTGVFYMDVDTAASGGIYAWRVQGEDATYPPAAKTGSFYVKPSDIGEESMGAWTSETRKTADQTVTNSDTLTDDTELQRSVLMDERYLFELDIVYSGDSTAADFKAALAASAGTMEGFYSYIGRAAVASTVEASQLLAAAVALLEVPVAGQSFGTGAAHTDVKVAQVTGMLVFSADCTFKFQFAQNVATALKSVKVLRGSRLRMKKLS